MDQGLIFFFFIYTPTTLNFGMKMQEKELYVCTGVAALQFTRPQLEKSSCS